MTGDCPCGGRLTESSHRISTESGAEKYGVASARMPIEVVTTICRPSKLPRNPGLQAGDIRRALGLLLN